MVLRSTTALMERLCFILSLGKWKHFEASDTPLTSSSSIRDELWVSSVSPWRLMRPDNTAPVGRRGADTDCDNEREREHRAGRKQMLRSGSRGRGREAEDDVGKQRMRSGSRG
ncbi:unnamed protein product [Pleuronectes platessa]|uniref:Uncharacterized protein n=1 Tax=Pleuronectes platessa TaxID=8262 RepID=A0A9N7TMD2_PLEPL|nr:unnamed protein product [Pleuronectes platessa]